MGPISFGGPYALYSRVSILVKRVPWRICFQIILLDIVRNIPSLGVMASPNRDGAGTSRKDPDRQPPF
jgi:hypothetical protein